jgi:hypothetical protein
MVRGLRASRGSLGRVFIKGHRRLVSGEKRFMETKEISVWKISKEKGNLGTKGGEGEHSKTFLGIYKKNNRFIRCIK